MWYSLNQTGLARRFLSVFSWGAFQGLKCSLWSSLITIHPHLSRGKQNVTNSSCSSKLKHNSIILGLEHIKVGVTLNHRPNTTVSTCRCPCVHQDLTGQIFCFETIDNLNDCHWFAMIQHGVPSCSIILHVSSVACLVVSLSLLCFLLCFLLVSACFWRIDAIFSTF